MKKSLILTLTLVLGLSVGSTVFAANPFELVPNDNWAYGAINDLNKAGVYAGYSDVNYQKGQTLTRNQIATLVAKAMANKNVTADQKATIDKLAAEYNDELVALGVTKADKGIDFSGFYRLRYQNNYDSKDKTQNGHQFRNLLHLDADAKVTDGWTVNASFEAYRNFYTDKGINGTSSTSGGGDGNSGAFDVTTASVTGPVAGTTMTIGKFANTFGSGLMFDDNVSGVKFEFGNTVKTKLLHAEVDAEVDAYAPLTGKLTDFNKVTSAEFSYDLSKASTLTASLQNWTSNKSGVDSLRVFDINVTSAINADYSVYATVDKTDADDYNKAYVLGVSYKGAKTKVAGSFGAWLDYEYFEKNTAIDTTYWVSPGQKGIACGFNYVPIKNIKWSNIFLFYKAMGANDLGQGTENQRWIRSQLYYYF
ncbi:MAG: S-layer protein [Firmicutes bacterium]|nr:S-layer protein [Bacillota bacterium]